MFEINNNSNDLIDALEFQPPFIKREKTRQYTF